MEPVRVFSGNVMEAGAVQQLLNDNQIGTWVRNTESSPILGDRFSGDAIEIYIEAQEEEKAKLVLDFKDF